MATKVLVFDDGAHTAPSSTPTDTFFLCYKALVWNQGEEAVMHDACSDGTIVEVAWADTAADIKTKIINAVIATFGVTAADVVFVNRG